MLGLHAMSTCDAASGCSMQETPHVGAISTVASCLANNVPEHAPVTVPDQLPEVRHDTLAEPHRLQLAEHDLPTKVPAHAASQLPPGIEFVGALVQLVGAAKQAKQALEYEGLFVAPLWVVWSRHSGINMILCQKTIPRQQTSLRTATA